MTFIALIKEYRVKDQLRKCDTNGIRTTFIPSICVIWENGTPRVLDITENFSDAEVYMATKSKYRNLLSVKVICHAQIVREGLHTNSRTSKRFIITIWNTNMLWPGPFLCMKVMFSSESHWRHFRFKWCVKYRACFHFEYDFTLRTNRSMLKVNKTLECTELRWSRSKELRSELEQFYCHFSGSAKY